MNFNWIEEEFAVIFCSFQINVNSKYNPSITHLCVIVHLFGTVRYVFEMTEGERKKFCGGNKDNQMK